MKTLTEQLSNYAAYHRDRRNIATHFIGVPMIMFAVVVLLSRPAWGTLLPWLPITPALLLAAVVAAYWLALDRPIGALTAAATLAMLVAATPIAAASTGTWLGWGIGLFVVGWIIQFVGHVWEGRKPAFVDDVIGLIIAPPFVVAEALFALGLRRELQAAIDAKVGPTVIRRRRDAAA
ncbi:MAG TPA: Mpo1-like protein [Burkholderiaceae bacterium]|nr:Mpo1-like protein [Burkholderiaceae bacterium]